MITEDNFSTLGVDVSLFRRQRGGPLYYYFTYPAGKIHRASTKKMNTRDARDVATAAVRAATATPTVARGSLMLAEAVDACIAARWPEKTGDSYKDAKSRLTTFTTWCETLDIAAFSADEFAAKIQAYITHRKKTVGARSLKNDQLVLSALCTWLLKNKRPPLDWQRNPADAKFLTLPPISQTKRVAPTDEAVQAAMDKARENEVWPVVVLCIGAAARPVGAAELKWFDIDFKKRTVTLTEKRRTRTISLGSWAMTELQAWKATHPGDKVFPFHKDWAFKCLRVLGHGGVTLQVMRRHAANKLMDELDPRAYADYTGHSLATAERHYREHRQASTHAEVSRALDWGKRGEAVGKK